jgi:hypothetical protein
MLAELQSALGVRRRDALGRVQRLEAALAAYRRAVEERVVAEFARDHGLRTPQLTGVSPETAARHLHEAVLALPELIDRGAEQSSAAPPQPSPTADTKPRSPSRVGTSTAGPTAGAPLPHLAALGTRKLVVIGALAGRQKSEAIPESLLPQTEWVDTGSGGAHAIGNLPQRIRQGRVIALVILDRAVQHKHSEPLVSAARAAGVPVGFAGKGGAASIRRALANIEEQLAARST